MITYKVTLAIESEVELEVEAEKDTPLDIIAGIAQAMWEEDGDGTMFPDQIINVEMVSCKVDCAAIGEC